MMYLKSTLIAVLAMTTLAACQDNKDPELKGKNLIDPSMVHNPRTANGMSLTEIGQMATLDFADTSHNFGSVNEGEKLTYDFAFTNHGKSPLLITGAVGSCGCTVVDFPREPIAPGKGGIMKAIFNTAGKPGLQEKGITVSANTPRGTHYLYIQAEVTPEKN